MTASIKSVLFVDYDSLYLGLRARDPATARRFAARPDVWIEALEAGLLVSDGTERGDRRRILMRLCYADPKLFGKARAAFAAQGFQIMDSAPLPGRERNAAEIQLVLDAVDALAHPTSFDEFILLAADTDLSPLLLRLRSHNRATAIYATSTSSAIYRSIADAAVEEGRLTEILSATDDSHIGEVDDEEEDEGAASPPGADLAAFARRIHQATNVPLLPPKVYDELFRALAAEVAENGYHFQGTAENVAARLVAAGRAASRRQVAFVVKGLALKGHVFSDGDTPDRLAEVFREQVLYLVRNAGLEIDETVDRQIQRWVAGRSAPAEAGPQHAAAEADGAAAETPEAREGSASVELAAQASEAEAPAQAAPAAEPLPSEPLAAEPPAGPEAPVAAPPVRAEPREAVAAERRAAPPVSIAAPAAPAGAAPPVAPPVPQRTLLTPGEAVAQPIIVLPAPAPTESAPEPDSTPPAERDPISPSLIAAIAEAVEGAATRDGATPTAAGTAETEEADEAEEGGELDDLELPPSDEAETRGEDGDIGDEIQRIVAAISQSRRPAGPG